MPSKRKIRRPAIRRRRRATELLAPARKPKIELYLAKINQEKIRSSGSAAACDFYASWKKSCCILDFSTVNPLDLVSQPLRGLLFRREPGGGMLWNPRSGAVYKLNEAAYHAVLDVEQGLSELEVARRNNLSSKTAQTLFRRLRQIA